VTVPWTWFRELFGPWSCTVWTFHQTVYHSRPFTVPDRPPFQTIHRSWPSTIPDHSPFLTVHRSWPSTVPDRPPFLTVHRSWPSTVPDRPPFLAAHRSWPFIVPACSPFLTISRRSWPFTIPDRSPFLTVFDCFMSVYMRLRPFLPLLFIIRIPVEPLKNFTNDRSFSGPVNEQERLGMFESELSNALERIVKNGHGTFTVLSRSPIKNERITVGKFWFLSRSISFCPHPNLLST
jgi:hypothetical protein